MSDPENFLSRWSRRKREVLRESEAVIPPPEAVRAAEKDRAPGKDSPRSAPAPPGPTFDPASLPPIQSITAETDIRGFLASGVPSELTRAALRRAWACDPAIRNFVGLADYDWDFNTADSMAGFGPLQMTDEVGKMAARILEPDRSEPGACNLLDPAPTIPEAEQISDKADTGTTHSATAEMHDQAKQRDEPVNEIGAPPHSNELTHRERGPAAVQYNAIRPDNRNVLFRRQHGGALPK
jgi:Protein of unknown function (DUF3306)